MNSKRGVALLLLLSAAMLCAIAGASAARLHAAEGSGRELLADPDDHEDDHDDHDDRHDDRDDDHHDDHDDHDDDHKVCWGEWYKYKKNYYKKFFIVLNERTRYGPPSSEYLCKKYDGKLLKVDNNDQLKITKLFKKCHVEKAWVDGAPHFATGARGVCLYYKAVFGSCKANGAGCGKGYKDKKCYKKLPTLCVKYKKNH